MIRIAVVEDDLIYQRRMKQYIQDYEQEFGESFQITVFPDGLEIVDHYTSSYDIIFMDIEMKHMNGMVAARRIRAIDKNVIIIFITNLAQFALQGYEVEALSYVLKPVNYFDFSQELKKAVKKVQGRTSHFLYVQQKDGVMRLDISKICYVESVGHNVIYHTQTDDITSRESLASVEEKLGAHNFSRCNSGYLVNLMFVEKVDRDSVVVFGTPLQISRRRQKDFMNALMIFVGGR